MNFFDVLAEMLVILFAIAAGYGANHLGYLGGETDQKLSKLILNITMPAMIVAAVITGEELHIGKLSLDGGEMQVDGRIDAVTYEDTEVRQGSFLSRLFG